MQSRCHLMQLPTVWFRMSVTNILEIIQEIEKLNLFILTLSFDVTIIFFSRLLLRNSSSLASLLYQTNVIYIDIWPNWSRRSLYFSKDISTHDHDNASNENFQRWCIKMFSIVFITDQVCTLRCTLALWVRKHCCCYQPMLEISQTLGWDKL